MRQNEPQRRDPQFPLYVVSKGRWDRRHTVKALEFMGVDYRVVVEEQERDKYEEFIPAGRLLTLDQAYKDRYDTCDDLGDTKSKGPGPARNYAWEHSISEGYAWHWVMDDNIPYFYRMNRNQHFRMKTGLFFRVMEDFCLRYENIGMAGPAYKMFVPRKQKVHPLILNTRIYSCNLIRNDLPYRWRGRYNEDTDLSLRMLKDRWCTVQFRAFIQNKLETGSVAGGCTREFYAVEGTVPKTEMLMKMHPDVARPMFRYGRYHHLVDYSRFQRNRLVRKPEFADAQGVDDYGMNLKEVV